MLILNMSNSCNVLPDKKNNNNAWMDGSRGDIGEGAWAYRISSLRGSRSPCNAITSTNIANIQQGRCSDLISYLFSGKRSIVEELSN